MRATRTKVVRVNLWWHGPSISVAKRKPRQPGEPDRPRLRLGRRTTARRGSPRQNGIKPVFSIIGTPPWANRLGAGTSRPRRSPTCERSRSRPRSATAAPSADAGRLRPAPRAELARLERAEQPRLPEAPVQAPVPVAAGRSRARRTTRRSATRSSAASSRRTPARRSPAGSPAPRGNNNPNSSRPSVSPLVFARATRAGGREGLRRLRPPPVLRHPGRDAVHEAASRPSRPARRPRSRSATSTSWSRR